MLPPLPPMLRRASPLAQYRRARPAASAGDWVRMPSVGHHQPDRAASQRWGRSFPRMDRRVSCPWTTALALGTVDEPLADPRLFPVTRPKFAPPLPAGRLTLTEPQWPLRRVPAPAPMPPSSAATGTG